MISFIIPAYNAEKCIGKCLDSIISQDYKNFEIIIINDGSNDSTKLIIEEYMKTYNDYDIYLYNINNSGQGNARNFGVEKATKEYVWFVDADDVLYDESVVSSAVIDLKSENPDIYIFSVFETDYDKRNIYWHYAKQNKSTNIYKTPSLVFKQNWAWNKPIKRSFLIESKILFSTKLMFEDIYFFCELYLKAKKIYITRSVKYIYVKHDDALTANSKNFISYPKALFHELITFFKIIFSKES